MQASLRAVVPCRLEFRDGVGYLLESLCGGLDQQLAYQVVSAFNEAFNNVVEHSGLGAQADVEVEAWRGEHELKLRIIDGGVAYEVSPVAEDFPELASLPEEGMGWVIIRRCMDEVVLERRDRNVLSMVRYLNRPAGVRI
ncbi:MAG: ATP-binding protein [Deltaproteobacteria bacterium]|nr:ATP-binding protein [Deltaproteobacteria bacterium]